MRVRAVTIGKQYWMLQLEIKLLVNTRIHELCKSSLLLQWWTNVHREQPQRYLCPIPTSHMDIHPNSIRLFI